MIHRSIIITTKRILPILALLAAVQLFAHGGFDHVMGTVLTITGNKVTVKTAAGTTDVKLDEKTEFTKDGLKAHADDLKPGMRVVFDIPEGSKDKIAHSVKMGVTAKAADPHEHDAHK
jgi:hypothetical protein